MGTAVGAGMAEGAAGSRRIAGIAESMGAGGATGPPRIVQHVEETLMAALPHLGAGEGWTSMKLARFLLKCTENQRHMFFMVAKLDLAACQVSVQKSLARSSWPHHFVSLRIVAACWPLRA